MPTDLRQGELAQSDTDLIIECQERWSFTQQAEAANRQEFEFDKRFVGGDQWDPTIRDERFSDRRPCLTVNITDAICRRVQNNCRENRPRVTFHPVGNGADVQTAKVFDGLMRHIEYASNAPYAYDTAVENAIQGGWGWLGIDAEYVSDDSFDQDLRICTWPNPLQVYGDPNSRQPDGSDMEFLTETIMMKRTEYKERFGRIDEAGWKWGGKGDDVPDWSNREEIRIAKYWRVERKKDRLLKLATGQTLFASQLPKGVRGQVQIIGERDVERRRVCSYLLTTFKVLKRLDWPGKWIPRVPVYGRRQDLNGRLVLKGMVRDLRDPARIYNYAQTKKTEMYALQPQAQWVGPEGFMDGHENAWRDSNRKPIVGLEWKPKYAENGELLPPPTRLDPPRINDGFAEWAGAAKSDFLHVAGMPHDPNADLKGEVVSGVALRKRQGLADVSNYDFYDNLTRSLRHLGRIVVDLVPHYYDTPRIIRIIREDGTAEQVGINQPQIDPMTQAVVKIKNDLTVGDYEVVVDTGPSYQTKREESAEAMLELLGTPLGELVAQTSGDLMVRSMDFPNSDMVADRLVAATPAAQMDTHNSDLPPKAQAMIAGLQAQLKQSNQKQLALELELQSKHQLEEIKQQHEDARHAATLHVKREDVLTKAHTAITDTHTKAHASIAVAEINKGGDIIKGHMDHAHELKLAERQLEHAAEEGEKDRSSSEKLAANKPKPKAK